MTLAPVSTKLFDVGFDIDDVLHPWGATAHELCRLAGLHDGTPTYGWKMWEAYGCTEEQWGEVIGRAVVEGGLYDVPPIPGSVEALRRLYWEGHRIHLVTARGFLTNGELIKQHTRDWLPEHAIPHNTLTFSKDKAAVARELGLDYFLDDGVHNFEQVDREAPNTQAYLLSAAHNLDYYTPFRLETVDEFVDLILEAAEQ